jgi:hypothetical protein
MLKKVLHLYWGRNQPLSYLRYLTIVSFQKYNPDWQVRVWAPIETSQAKPWGTNEQVSLYRGVDYFEHIIHLVTWVDFAVLGLPNSLSEVHKSDLLRWYLLGTEGGIWSDFDILYVKGISDNIMEQWKEGAGLMSYRAVPKHPFDYLAIGFHTSSGESGRNFFMELFKLGLSKVPQDEYQAFGAVLLQEHLKNCNNVGAFYITPPELIYPYHTYHNILRYWQPGAVDGRSVCIGMHWYAGMQVSGKKEALVTEETIEAYSKEYAICREALDVIKI